MLKRAIAAARGGHAICVPTHDDLARPGATIAPDDLSVGCVGLHGRRLARSASAWPWRNAEARGWWCSTATARSSCSSGPSPRSPGAAPRNLAHLLFKNGVYHTSGSQGDPRRAQGRLRANGEGRRLPERRTRSPISTTSSARLPSMLTDEGPAPGRAPHRAVRQDADDLTAAVCRSTSRWKT